MKVSQIVAERFEVSEFIGSGACGAVFRAWDRVLEREVAIKQLARGSDERVMQTSRAAARLNHPAIVALFEVGETDEGAFLVSEFIDGLTLRQAHAEGRLTDSDVAEIGADLCDGLHHAHCRGVVHGDVKPENVIVRPREDNPDQRSGRCQAKLRDFATREILGDTEPEREPSAYLTPEQIEGQEPGPQSDVYAIALILFECWTGQNPAAGAAGARIARIRARHVPSLAELRPDLPPRLVELIDSALDVDPSRRPQPLEMREWLDHVFDDLDDELAVPEPAAPPPPRRRLRDRAGAAATLLAAAALAIGGAAPAVFAIASWPAGWIRRALLAAAATLAALVATAAIDPGLAPVALASGSGIAERLLTAHVAALVALWALCAAVLGALARAAAPVSGAALGAGFSLVALIATELLARASAGVTTEPLVPLALIGAGVIAGAITVSRLAAGRARPAASDLGDAGLEAGPIEHASLLPPEPDEGELVVSVHPERGGRDVRLARVP